MKKNLLSATVLVLLAMTVPLVAQETRPIHVNVPFNFVVENDRMPAGQYTIQRLNTGRLMIRRDDMTASANVLALPTEGKTTVEKTRIVFRHYGDQYFLYKIWTPGLEVGWQLMQGKLETELAKKGVPVLTASLEVH